MSNSRVGMFIMLYFPRHQEQINIIGLGETLASVRLCLDEALASGRLSLPYDYLTLFPLASDAPENLGLLTAVMNAEASK
jgi:hypothetical protein